MVPAIELQSIKWCKHYGLNSLLYNTNNNNIIIGRHSRRRALSFNVRLTVTCEVPLSSLWNWVFLSSIDNPSWTIPILKCGWESHATVMCQPVINHRYQSSLNPVGALYESEFQSFAVRGCNLLVTSLIIATDDGTGWLKWDSVKRKIIIVYIHDPFAVFVQLCIEEEVAPFYKNT